MRQRVFFFSFRILIDFICSVCYCFSAIIFWQLEEMDNKTSSLKTRKTKSLYFATTFFGNKKNFLALWVTPFIFVVPKKNILPFPDGLAHLGIKRKRAGPADASELTQSAFTSSKSTKETQQGVKYVQR